MKHKAPILLSFYGLSNGSTTLVYGQLTFTRLEDLSFKDYSRRRTFRTLFALYQTKPYANQEIVLVFDTIKLNVKTDGHGAFYLKTNFLLSTSILQKVVMSSGEEVKIIQGLYPRHLQEVTSEVIVVSDIDDTLLHSFIFRKIMKFKTLMFTTVEKRRAVVAMQDLLHKFTDKGAVSFYLSNSEQNLYPLIYRFLLHNGFPAGPLFLKKMRRLWDVIRNIKFPLRNIHKQKTLEDILEMFPEKKIVLMGDNTQHDLTIYLEAAEKFPVNIKYILIRKVIEKRSDEALRQKYAETLKQNNITLYYSDIFPHDFEL
jgi:phosphatidate phosphatase APP1